MCLPLTRHEPIAEAYHVRRPEPEASRIGFLVVVLPVPVVFEADLPQTDVLELVARRRVRLRPVGRRKRNKSAQAGHENQHARREVATAEGRLTDEYHSVGPRLQLRRWV